MNDTFAINMDETFTINMNDTFAININDTLVTLNYWIISKERIIPIIRQVMLLFWEYEM